MPTCHRCKSSESSIHKHQLTCQNCQRSWHIGCHVPVIDMDELVSRMKGSLEVLRGSASVPKLTSENWLCRRCQTRRVETPSVVEADSKSSVKTLLTAPKTFVEQVQHPQVNTTEPHNQGFIEIVSDSDSDDIQILSKPPVDIGRAGVNLAPASAASGSGPGASSAKTLAPDRVDAPPKVEVKHDQSILSPDLPKHLPLERRGLASNKSNTAAEDNTDSPDAISPGITDLHTMLPARGTEHSQQLPRSKIVTDETVDSKDPTQLNRDSSTELPKFRKPRAARKISLVPSSPTPSYISDVSAPGSSHPSSSGPRSLEDIVRDLRIGKTNYISSPSAIAVKQDIYGLVHPRHHPWLPANPDIRVAKADEKGIASQDRRKKTKSVAKRFNSEKYDPDLFSRL